MQETKETRAAALVTGSGRSPEEGMATHSSVLAWSTPWTEEPTGLRVHRVEKSQTQLKRLSMHAYKKKIDGNTQGE